MFIFNTTFSVQNDSIGEWRNWMNRNYLPTMQDLIKDIRIELYQVMTVVEDSSTNYSCQLKVNTPEDLEVINKYSAILINNLSASFGERCLHFSSILKEA